MSKSYIYLSNGLLTACLMVLLSIFTSCSDTEEPNLTPSNEVIYKTILLQCMDEEGNIEFTPHGEIQGMYVVPVANAQDAHAFVASLIMQNWNGKVSTLNLEDYGYVRIAPGTKDGVFISMSFALKNQPTFSLELATLEYCNNVNAENVFDSTIGFYVCPNCGCWSLMHLPYCNICEPLEYYSWITLRGSF